ncbi:MAG: 16S rRNA (cytosine(967)-C(5))-methyltransferase RsmB [Clostridia bacterium]|nr:16S rRNA (cytosine(967)-C(5))-methyltransferase RsmB [Clostridia bacterium]
MSPARETALRALIAFRREGTWPDLYLKRASRRLSTDDAALAARLTYGVLENRAYLDFLIGAFSNRPMEKLTPQVLDALRLAAYQLVFLQRIPQSAAVNEAVEQVKKAGNPGAGAFANGLLRSLERRLSDLPQVPREDPLTYLSTRYSHPRWFVGKMRKRLGDEGCEALLQADNAPAPVTARVNTLKTDRAALLRRLEERGCPARVHPDLENALILEQPGAALRTGLMDEGLLYIQDAASQLCVEALDPRPGETVLDLCAAPGGKALLAAQKMKNTGEIVALELHPHRVELMKKNAVRMGVTCLRAVAGDASTFCEAPESVDAVLCDVPCSGMGVIRKKPDVRYKDGDSIKALPPLQLAILKNGAACLRPGGRLVYSTCTLLREENEAVIEAFLQENSGFAREAFSLPGIGACAEGQITLWPQIHGTDGFFIAKLRKIRG